MHSTALRSTLYLSFLSQPIPSNICLITFLIWICPSQQGLKRPGGSTHVETQKSVATSMAMPQTAHTHCRRAQFRPAQLHTIVNTRLLALRNIIYSARGYSIARSDRVCVCVCVCVATYTSHACVCHITDTIYHLLATTNDYATLALLCAWLCLRIQMRACK